MPTDCSETVPFDTEQTSGVFDVKTTGKPAEDVAVIANGPKLTERGGIVLKVMTCVGFVIVTLRFKAGAEAYSALPA